MRMVLRARREAGDLPNARGKQRETWNRNVLVNSILIASVFHAGLFAIVPNWDISHLLRPDSEFMEVIQIDPVLSYGTPMDPGLGEVAAMPTEEEIELVMEESGQGDEPDRPDLAEVLGAMRPSIVFRVAPDAASGSEPASAIPPLLLEHLEAISPEVAKPTLDVSWPLIRNPTVLQRFFRRRYNPLYGGEMGSVSVAMWINERGSVEWAAVQESSGSPILDDIALDAFNEIVAFSPARSQGAPIPVSVVISVPFNVPW